MTNCQIQSADNSVWTTGHNFLKILGRAGKSEMSLFAKVEGLPPVKMIAIGLSQCVAVTHDDKVQAELQSEINNISPLVEVTFHMNAYSYSYEIHY